MSRKALDEAVLDDVDLDSAEEDSVTDFLIEEQEGQKSQPMMTDPEWTGYVLSHFEPNEVNQDGHPCVTGLRRVARLLLGPILESCARVVQSPSYVEGSQGRLQPATVEYRLVLLCCQPPLINSGAYKVIFADCADVYAGNTDAEYARYASATAATRAEGRCLRKALQLQGVICAEEVTDVPVDESGIDGKISPSQITFINVLCERTGIDVMKYVNSGSRQYQTVDEIDFDVAVKMVRHLGELQRINEIPENLKKG